ncbi:HV01 protein, partial [Bombycilla garrulus]|nr:HV01 protein [Bombycilla garrulus]
GLWAQLRLQEAGGGLRAPGDSVTFSCRGFGLTFSYYDIWWYRQASRGSPELVSWISTTSFRKSAPDVEGRVSVSRDDSQSESSLSLRALGPQDSARYFCAVLHG